MTVGSEAIDQDSFARLRASIPVDRMAHLMELFRTTGREYVRRIIQGHTNNDLDEVRLAAHTLKSSAAIIGATELADALTRIEAKARADILPTQAEVDALRDHFRAVVEQLPET